MVEQILGCGMSPEEVIKRMPEKYRHLMKETTTVETLGHLY
jgi:hypothetical protein